MPPVIIDGHAHAWRRWPYQPSVPDPANRGRAEQLLHEMDRNGVDSAILIGAAISGNRLNNRYLVSLQRRWPGRFHAFPDFDSYWTPASNTFDPTRRLATLLADGPIRGVSTYLADDEDGRRLLEPRHSRAFALAAQRRLLVSLAIRPQHAPAVRELATSYPELTLLCHHFGGVTARRAAPLDDQLRSVLTLRAQANIVIKLSGFPYLSQDPWRFPFDEHADLIRQTYDAFGADRLCWGSNYPVIDGAITYRQSLEALHLLLPDVSAAEKDAILGGTLTRLLGR